MDDEHCPACKNTLTPLDHDGDFHCPVCNRTFQVAVIDDGECATTIPNILIDKAGET